MNLLAAVPGLLCLIANADTNGVLLDWDWRGILMTLIYGPIAIILVMLGFKVFDWLNPRIDIQRELSEKNNLAVAIVVAAIVLGICFVVANVVN